MKRYVVELRQEDDGRWIGELLTSGGSWLGSAWAEDPADAARGAAYGILD